MALGTWKLGQMGLLPTAHSDWLAFLGAKEPIVQDQKPKPKPKQVKVPRKRRQKENDAPRRSSGRLAGVAPEAAKGLDYFEAPVNSDESDDDEDDFVVGDDVVQMRAPLKRRRVGWKEPVKRKRKGSSTVTYKGGRAYDPVNGTSCHQCRQKTIDAKVKCTNVLPYLDAKTGKIEQYPCNIMMDELCLVGRYGEQLQESIDSGCWICPRYRGSAPTGQLKHVALQHGFKGVSQYLESIGQMKRRGKKGIGRKKMAAPTAEEEGDGEEIEAAVEEQGKVAMTAIKAEKEEGERDSGKEVEEGDGEGESEGEGECELLVILEP
ncbi:hypothetical protein HK101_002602 [Irineochytrium annulatum]|nr:hypothetical protein HK101_002602 [Irineochytrium annulatum]